MPRSLPDARPPRRIQAPVEGLGRVLRVVRRGSGPPGGVEIGVAGGGEREVRVGDEARPVQDPVYDPGGPQRGFEGARAVPEDPADPIGGVDFAHELGHALLVGIGHDHAAVAEKRPVIRAGVQPAEPVALEERELLGGVHGPPLLGGDGRRRGQHRRQHERAEEVVHDQRREREPLEEPGPAAQAVQGEPEQDREGEIERQQVPGIPEQRPEAGQRGEHQRDDHHPDQQSGDPGIAARPPAARPPDDPVEQRPRRGGEDDQVCPPVCAGPDVRVDPEDLRERVASQRGDVLGHSAPAGSPPGQHQRQLVRQVVGEDRDRPDDEEAEGDRAAEQRRTSEPRPETSSRQRQRDRDQERHAQVVGPPRHAGHQA